MVQDLIVAIIVVAAALYSVWMFMPAPARRASAARLAALARRFGLGEQDTERLRATLSTHSSCGQCASCKGCATVTPRTAPAETGNAAGEPAAAQPIGN